MSAQDFAHAQSAHAREWESRADDLEREADRLERGRDYWFAKAEAYRHLIVEFERIPRRRVTNHTVVFERAALDDWRARCGADSSGVSS